MSKKVKKLSLQYSYLQLEEEEVSEICLEVEEEMRLALKETYPEEFKLFYGPSNAKPEDSEDSEDSEDIKRNPDVKKLYRHIAKKIHPDKEAGGDEEQFKLAAQAYRENNIAVLLQIASRHNIELTEMSQETINLFEDNITTLQKKIASKKGSSAWYFSQAKTPEDKLNILAFIAEHIRGTKNA